MPKRTKKYEITCVDCQHPYETIRKNTKRCRVCQIVRDLQYMAAKNKVLKLTCVVCDVEFWPLSSEKTPFCGECNRVPSPLNVRDHCDWCDRDNVLLVHDDVRICRGCATKPDNRPRLLKALTLKVQRREQNPPESAKTPAPV